MFVISIATSVFENVPHGEYAVAVEADGWTTAEETVAFEGDTDEETDLRQTIQLSPEQSGDETDESLTVVVEDEAEDPVAGEPVTITYEDESTSERETNEDGEVVLNFDITDGSADNVTITVTVGDEDRDVIIEDGEDLTETFTVETDTGTSGDYAPYSALEITTVDPESGVVEVTNTHDELPVDLGGVWLTATGHVSYLLEDPTIDNELGPGKSVSHEFGLYDANGTVTIEDPDENVIDSATWGEDETDADEDATTASLASPTIAP